MRWYVVEIYARSGTARRRFESLFAARGAFPTYGGSRHERNCPTAGATLAYLQREILLNSRRVPIDTAHLFKSTTLRDLAAFTEADVAALFQCPVDPLS